jgi:hypothetical protein
MAGRLAPASEVAGSRTYLYKFKKGVVCQFKNGMVCSLATFKAGADGRPSSANFSYSCTKLVTPIYLLH